MPNGTGGGGGAELPPPPPSPPPRLEPERKGRFQVFLWRQILNHYNNFLGCINTPKKETIANPLMAANSQLKPKVVTINPPIIVPTAVVPFTINFQSAYSLICLPPSKCSAKIAKNMLIGN